MFLFTPLPLKILLVAVIVAAVVVGLVFLIRYLRRRSVRVLAKGISDNMEDFYGMFESLQAIAEGKTDKQEETIGLWYRAVRAATDNGSGFKEDFFKRFGDYTRWDKDEKWRYTHVAKTVLRAAKQAGVIRGEEVFVAGNETTAQRYVLPGDGVIYYDKTYQVLAPCWLCEEEVVDKGVIR